MVLRGKGSPRAGRVPAAAGVGCVSASAAPRSVFVFPSATGNKLDAGRPNDWLNEAIRKTELPRLTFHGLRHTAISLMAVEGVPITTTMAIVGHRTMRMTAERYSHVPDAAKRDAMEKVGRALG